MEQKFYRDEFEQMLRDTTDDFRMYPQRKVWYSIYNNFHPDRKWPSLAVSLILLTVILYVGITNNNSINKTRTTLSDSIAVKSLLAQNQLIYQPGKVVIRSTRKTQIPYPTATTDASSEDQNTPTQNIQTAAISTGDVHLTLSADNIHLEEIDASDDLTSINTANQMKMDIEESKQKHTSLLVNQQESSASAYKNKSEIIVSDTKAIEPLQPTAISDMKPDAALTNSNNAGLEAKAISKLKTSLVEDKEWIEDYAFHNKKNNSKWKNKLSSQFYFTPSIGFRTSFKNNNFEPNFTLLQRQSRVTDPEAVAQQAAMNIEVGASLIKQVNRRIRLNAGLQFNYSNYVTYAHKLQHPGQTTVLLNDLNTGALVPTNYSSGYGNVMGENNAQLNNSSTQLSIPIGVDYKLMGNNKISWYAGASIQPGYILNGNSYLISADYKHFAEDESLLRNFNINSSVETFISIKTSTGSSINLGPQLRYQLLSTHTKQYSYTEKYYNLGFKIGLSKKL